MNGFFNHKGHKDHKGFYSLNVNLWALNCHTRISGSMSGFPYPQISQICQMVFLWK